MATEIGITKPGNGGSGSGNGGSGDTAPSWMTPEERAKYLAAMERAKLYAQSKGRQKTEADKAKEMAITYSFTDKFTSLVENINNLIDEYNNSEFYFNGNLKVSIGIQLDLKGQLGPIGADLGLNLMSLNLFEIKDEETSTTYEVTTNYVGKDGVYTIEQGIMGFEHSFNVDRTGYIPGTERFSRNTIFSPFMNTRNGDHSIKISGGGKAILGVEFGAQFGVRQKEN